MPTRTTSRTRANNGKGKTAPLQPTRHLVVCRGDGQFKSTVDPENIARSSALEGPDK